MRLGRNLIIQLCIVVVVLLRCVLVFSDTAGFLKNEINQTVVGFAKPELIRSDLWQIYLSEVNDLNSEQIRVLNNRTIAGIQEQKIEIFNNTKRVVMAPSSVLNSILDFTQNHPLFGVQQADYERQGAALGYCFGRATFLHLLFLRLGLQKESIQKIWVLGHIKNDRRDGFWQFHVATMVYTDQRDWVVLDANIGYPLSARDWVQYYEQANPDGKLRFYYTSASKFGPSLGQYNRLQLGLDMAMDQDWYKHYFVDMMTYFKNTSLTQMGLSHF